MSLTKDIQNAVCKSEIQKGNIVSENFQYFFAGELDVLSLHKSGYVSEYEIKISRSDFKADAKKRKWLFYDNGLGAHTPNYFTYVCPEGMIKESDLKDYMGLIYFNEGKLTVIRKAKIIHKHKQDIIKLLTKIACINNWRHYFGASQLTILNREIKERNSPEAESQWNDITKNVHKNTTYKQH